MGMRARAGTLARAGIRPGPAGTPKMIQNNLQMTIARPSEGPWGSSFAHPKQVDHAGAHGIGPDRFRAPGPLFDENKTMPAKLIC